VPTCRALPWRRATRGRAETPAGVPGLTARRGAPTLAASHPDQDMPESQGPEPPAHAGAAPPPVTGGGAPPAPLTSFVGRARELASVRARLGDPGVRLLTLTGPGGAGKTRLALEAARDLEGGGRFADGVWFTGLAPLADAALVPQGIATALGVREEAGRPL